MMNKKFSPLLNQLLPYLILGISIALVIGLFIMISYVLLWGLVIGAIIWLIVVIKNYFFPSATKKGHIINHDDPP